jgi:hypothetical protein
MMKGYWTSWKKGWWVAFNYFWFVCVLSFFCIPITIVQMLPTGAGEDSGRLDWQSTFVLIVTVAWLPVAFSKASAFTGEFREEEGSESRAKIAESSTPPNGGSATPADSSGVARGSGPVS